jgi:hypothetical protein
MKTAVEFLIDWMSKNQYFIGNDLLKAVEQAKVMEKEQIDDAWDSAYTSEGYFSGEEYYKATFKSEEIAISEEAKEFVNSLNNNQTFKQQEQ